MLAFLPLSSLFGCAAGTTDPPAGGSGGGGGAGGGTGGGLLECQGTVQCDDKGIATICADDGTITQQSCKAEGKICLPGIGCGVCVPGEGTCQNGQAVACKYDGSGMINFECDPQQGMVCEPDGCKGDCSPVTLGPSYIGCDYYPTVTLNTGLYWSGFPFAIAVGNTSSDPAQVLVTRGDQEVQKVTVAGNDLAIIELPWIDELRGPEPSVGGSVQLPPLPEVVTDGAYRMRSDRPVTVYQFSPLSYEIKPAPAECPEGSMPGCFSFSNDASLLLPVHVFGTTYPIVTWPTLGCRSGFIAVTAVSDNTKVTIKATSKLTPGAGLTMDGSGSVLLQQGDVVQLLTEPVGGPFCFLAPGGDLSGSRIVADKPVQVIGGHACANLPTPDTQACDHLEEAMFPLETLGKEYVVTVPASPSGGKSPHTLRIVAVEDGTEVVLSPPLVEKTTLASGEVLEITNVLDDAHVTANHPFLIAEMMQGSDSVPDHTGDPSQSLAVPVAQFRTKYVFLAPESYDQNFVNVIAPTGAAVTVDGQAVPSASFEELPSGGLSVARVALSGGQIHTAESAKKFGITVYGYGTYTSYMYPGGLDLAAISLDVPK